jgi:hypothetical protein
VAMARRSFVRRTVRSNRGGFHRSGPQEIEQTCQGRAPVKGKEGHGAHLWGCNRVDTLASSADFVDRFRQIGEVLREGEKRVGGGVLGPFNRRSCMEEGLGFARGHRSMAGRDVVCDQGSCQS